MIEVPSWLYDRSISIHYNPRVSAFLADRNVSQFGCLSQRLLAEMWAQLGQEETLSFCRFVGFYGVHFYGELSYLWPRLDPEPVRLLFPPEAHEDPISPYILDLYPALGQFLLRYCLKQKTHLHGVPAARLSSVIGTQRNDDIAHTLGASIARDSAKSDRDLVAILSELPGEVNSTMHKDFQPLFQEAEEALSKLLGEADGWMSLAELRGSLNISSPLSSKLEVWLRFCNRLRRPYYFDRQVGLVMNCSKEEYQRLLDILVEDLDSQLPISDQELDSAVQLALTCQVGKLALPQIVTALKFHRLVPTRQGTWIRRRSRRLDYYQDAIFKLYTGEVELRSRVDYILKRLKGLLPADQELPTQSYLLSILRQSPDLVRVRRNNYIHIRRLRYDPAMIDYAIRACLDRFEDKRHQFSIRLIFRAHHHLFQQAGITTEALLFSLLRREGNPEVGFAGSDQIFCSREIETPRSSQQVLVEFVSRQRRPVSMSGLKREFCEGWGWTSTRLERELSLCSPSIVKVEKSYVHVRRLDINKTALKQLYHELKHRLRKHQGRISLTAIAKDKPVLWQSLGDYSPRVIHAALRHYRPRSFYYQAPLSLSYRKQDAEKTQHQLVARFLRKQSRAVPWAVLSKAFCDDRGWSETALYKAIRTKVIFQVLPREYAHRSALGWTQQKQEQLKRLVTESLKQQHIERGEAFLSLESIVERLYSQLPRLAIGNWSGLLLGQLLALSKGFVVIETCVVMEQAAPQMRELQDLVAYILARDLKGAAAEKSLIEHLQRLKLTDRRTFPKEFDGNDLVEVSGATFSLSRLAVEKYKHFLSVKPRNQATDEG